MWWFLEREVIAGWVHNQNSNSRVELLADALTDGVTLGVRAQSRDDGQDCDHDQGQDNGGDITGVSSYAGCGAQQPQRFLGGDDRNGQQLDT